MLFDCRFYYQFFFIATIKLPTPTWHLSFVKGTAAPGNNAKFAQLHDNCARNRLFLLATRDITSVTYHLGCAMFASLILASINILYIY
jgi:hypothetical protein